MNFYPYKTGSIDECLAACRSARSSPEKRAYRTSAGSTIPHVRMREAGIQAFFVERWRGVTVPYCFWFSLQPSLIDVSTLFWDAMAQS